MLEYIIVDDVLALLRSIRENRLSRNRHFDVHATAHGLAARRLHRFLRGVERDLLLPQILRLRKGE